MGLRREGGVEGVPMDFKGRKETWESWESWGRGMNDEGGLVCMSRQSKHGLI